MLQLPCMLLSCCSGQILQEAKGRCEWCPCRESKMQKCTLQGSTHTSFHPSPVGHHKQGTETATK